MPDLADTHAVSIEELRVHNPDIENIRIARWTGVNPRSAKAPNRSLAAMRAEAASRVTTGKGKGV